MAKLKVEKPRLTILLGAGASVAAGIPSTRDLTQRILRNHLTVSPTNVCHIGEGLTNLSTVYPIEQPLFQVLEAGLRSKIREPNFEHILAVLEQMTGLAMGQANTAKADDFVNVVTPFIWIEERYRALRDSNALPFARKAFERDIFDCIINAPLYPKAGGPIRHTAMESFLRALHERFRLSIFTLNYDQLVEETTVATWYDGFKNQAGNPAYYEFDTADFVSKADPDSDTELLCHLHGSIRFGHAMTATDIVKFDTEQQAFQSLGIWASDHFVDGTAIPRSPIISGVSKASKLTYLPVPYGHYFRAFCNSLMKCPRLLIVGYGGYDAHINSWLEQFRAVHGTSLKAGFVTVLDGKQVGDNFYRPFRIMDGLTCLVAPSMSHQSNCYYRQGHKVEFCPIGSLAVCTAGFPLKTKKTLTSLIKHLS